MPKEKLLQWSNLTRKAKGGVACSCSLPKHLPRDSKDWGHLRAVCATCFYTEQTSSGWGMKSEYWDPIYQHRSECSEFSKLPGQAHRDWTGTQGYRSNQAEFDCSTTNIDPDTFPARATLIFSLKVNCQLLVLCWLADQHLFSFSNLSISQNQASKYINKHFNSHKNDD